MMMKMLHDIKPSRFDTSVLQNTDSYDTKEIKNKQISINLVDNSIIEYNIQLDDIINDQINNDIPYIDLIKYNKNNKVTCKIYIKSSTIDRLQKEYRRKYDSGYGISTEIESILDEHLDKIETQLENETATSSSSFIKYNGTIPRIDVLERLSDMGEQLKNDPIKVFSKLELKRMLERQEGISDGRIVKKYLACLIEYSIKKNQANIAFDKYNMTGFHTSVLHLIKNREVRND